jgi:membrane-associated phospholipid phosphatase
MRVLTGAHYLSDAVLGWLSSVVIFAGVLVIFETLQHRRDAA